MRRTLETIVEARGATISPEGKAVLDACGDADTLRRWLLAYLDGEPLDDVLHPGRAESDT